MNTDFLTIDQVGDVVFFLVVVVIFAGAILTWRRRSQYWTWLGGLLRKHGFTPVPQINRADVEPPHLITANQGLFGPTRTIHFKGVYRHESEQVRVALYDVILARDNERVWPDLFGHHILVSVFLSELDRPLMGWVQLKPERSVLKNTGRDLRLESNEFNRNVDVQAEPGKLAPLVFPPDVMEWYLRLDRRFWVHVEGRQCGLAREGRLSNVLVQECLANIKRLRAYVDKSGALEKTI